MITLDHAEAKGTIEIVENSYGADIVVNGNVVATVDLFFLAYHPTLKAEKFYTEDEIADGVAIRRDVEHDAVRIVVLK